MNNLELIINHKEALELAGAIQDSSNLARCYIELHEKIAAMTASTAEPVKDHVIAQVVNDLRDIANKFHGMGQLRERIAHVIVPLLKPSSQITASGVPEKLTVAMCSSSQYCKGWNDCVDAMIAAAPSPARELEGGKG